MTAQDTSRGSGAAQAAPDLVGDAAVAAEVAAVFAAYEAALVANDVERLTEAFWTSPLTVRYGTAECLYGSEEIEAWRRTAAPVPLGRTLQRTTIAAFGPDAACVSTEFRHPDSDGVGRQSQTWVRMAEGWRIVSAHVSVIGA